MQPYNFVMSNELTRKDFDALEKRVAWLERHLVDADQVPYDLTTKLGDELRKKIKDLETKVKSLEK